MATFRYLTSEDVVEAHRLVLEWMDSPPRPLLRPDALDSALARPAWAALYEGASLVEQAVSLAIGISQSQAFEDGNKRAAFAAVEIFLVANGHVFAGDPLGFANRLFEVAEAPRDRRDGLAQEFSAWLAENVLAIPQDESS